MTDELARLRERTANLLKMYDEAMASLEGADSGAKIAAMANYGEIALNLLRSGLKTAAAPSPSDAEKVEGRAFKLGERVEKTKGSSWRGKIVGFYSTELTPIGYCVESEREAGSVQIYPQAALNLVSSTPPSDAGDSFKYWAMGVSPEMHAPPPDAEKLKEAKKYEAMRHEANEWADMSGNGLQWLRNIKAGLSTVDEALENMNSNFEHCKSVADARAALGDAS